ncbi:hypothetical protein R1sor_013905 [Riccia sorocarpa]|uniref:Uncharacterized protein n=1 Tax=Riccia sorocarpa TaxID=122646 RepID=A0ABD3HC11_9MARC
MNKRSYMCLLEMICEHHVFDNNFSCPQAEVLLQLAVALDRFAHEGNGVCLNRTMLMWEVSHGSMTMSFAGFAARILMFADICHSVPIS